MSELSAPARAIRKLPGFERPNPGVWHFQSNDNKNKTVCGLIIAPNPNNLSRDYWEVSTVNDIKGDKGFCKKCLGPLVVVSNKKIAQVPMIFEVAV